MWLQSLANLLCWIICTENLICNLALLKFSDNHCTKVQSVSISVSECSKSTKRATAVQLRSLQIVFNSLTTMHSEQWAKNLLMTQSCHARTIHGGPKMAQFFLYSLTSSNINRFSKLFHCQSQEKMCNNTITKDPTTPQMCRYTTLCCYRSRFVFNCCFGDTWHFTR